MPINIGPGGRFYGTGGAKTLPRDLIISSGSLLEGWETADDWTASGTSIKTANTSQVKEGAQSLKLTTDLGTESTLIKTVSWDLTGDWQQMRYWAYIHDALSDYAASQVNVFRLYSTAFSASYQFFQTKNAIQHTGWRLQTCAKSLATIYNGTPTWDIVSVACRVPVAVGKTPSVSWDGLYQNVRAHPCIMFRFDDGYISQYTQAFSYMRRYGMRGTLFQIGSWIDASTRVTHQHLQEMQNAGWTIGNHTRNSSDLTAEASQAAQEAQIANGKIDLDAWGLTGGLYVAYPMGRWNVDTVTSMTNFGARLGWTAYNASYTNGDTQYPPTVLPLMHPYDELGAINVTTSLSLATLKGYIEAAIAGGFVISLIFHGIGTGGSDWSIADFRALVDYIYSKRAYITPITIDDYYRASLGSISVPELVG